MKMEFSMPDDLVIRLEKLTENKSAIIDKVLSAGAEVVKKRVRANMAQKIGQETKYPARSSGQLLNALGASPVKQDGRHNYNIKVGLADARNDGQINARIANVIEHGRPGRKKHRIRRKDVNQQAKPMFANAKRSAKKMAIDAMETEFLKQVRNLEI